MESVEFVIVGAGFAGASTAWHLAAAGHTDVLLLDREPAPGMHSSGRNAAIVRQVVPDRSVTRLARESVHGIRSEFARSAGAGSRITESPITRCGSLLLLAGGKAPAAELMAAGSRAGSRLFDRRESVEKVALLEGARFDAALFTPGDGVADAAVLLDCFISGARERGVRVRWKCEVTALSGSELWTSHGPVRAHRIVNAAGAWAGPLAEPLGGSRLPLRPTRRHLFLTRPLSPAPDPGLPFVWDLDREMYFRPEGEGLLMSPCDEEDWPPSIPPASAAAAGLMAEKLRAFPRLARASRLALSTSWAGLRTLTPDGGFVIGQDPRNPSLFWVAGLAGHGVTTSFAVGRVAAAALLGEAEPMLAGFSPARFG